MKKYQAHYKPELHKTNIIHKIIREKPPGKVHCYFIIMKKTLRLHLDIKKGTKTISLQTYYCTIETFLGPCKKLLS